jgi:hypothetical protein
MHDSPTESPAPPAPSPPNSPREAARAQLEIEKLELEVSKLRREGTLFSRIATLVLPMFVASVTAFVAILGIGISAWTLRQQRAFQETDSHSKALQAALDLATDQRGQADRRISGINQLRPFWGNEADEQASPRRLAVR